MQSTPESVKEKIRVHLESVRGGVFTESDLSNMLMERGSEWGLRKRISIRAFINLLTEEVGLRTVELRAEHYRRVMRFAWREFSPYLMALSLRPRSYLSHGTAVLLHALNDQLPKTIYVNQEQSEKPRSGHLSQERLTLAFQRRQRTSNYVYSFDGFRAVLLSGKQTGALGVVKLKGPQGEVLPVTGLARTLIDIVV